MKFLKPSACAFALLLPAVLPYGKRSERHTVDIQRLQDISTCFARCWDSEARFTLASRFHELDACATSHLPEVKS